MFQSWLDHPQSNAGAEIGQTSAVAG